MNTGTKLILGGIGLAALVYGAQSGAFGGGVEGGGGSKKGTVSTGTVGITPVETIPENISPAPNYIYPTFPKFLEPIIISRKEQAYEPSGFTIPTLFRSNSGDFEYTEVPITKSALLAAGGNPANVPSLARGIMNYNASIAITNIPETKKESKIRDNTTPYERSRGITVTSAADVANKKKYW